MTKIKICGVTSIQDANVCVEAGADFLGFVLSDSPRRVSYEQLGRLRAAVDGSIQCVGVFASENDLMDFSQNCDVELDYYQVYFDATALNVRNPRAGWIRAIWMNGESHNLSRIPLPTLLDFKRSDLTKMRDQLAPHRDAVGNAVILAGRLSPDNVGVIVRELVPWGVDVARGTEAAPGRKDHQLVRRFIENVKNAR